MDSFTVSLSSVEKAATHDVRPYVHFDALKFLSKEIVVQNGLSFVLCSAKELAVTRKVAQSLHWSGTHGHFSIPFDCPF